jgi:hypothetical protein
LLARVDGIGRPEQIAERILKELGLGAKQPARARSERRA